MSLKNCIIHHLERAVPGADLSSSLREKENSCSGPAYSLFEQLKQSFQRSSQKQYGHFNRDLDDNPVPGWLKEQLQGKSSFARCSQRLMEQLQQRLGDNDEAFSAHIMIALETVMEQDQLYIFWIDHIDASYIDSDQEVGGTRYVDGSKLQYAARLFVEEWLEQDSQKYLAMITSRGNKKLSDAYELFLGFSNGLDVAEETSEFLSILDDYTETLSETLPEEKVQDYRSKILDYCVEQDKLGAPVVFEDISAQLDEKKPEEFASFIAQQQEVAKPEIYTDRNSLKRYVRYFGRDKNISISFAAEMLGEGIVYDEESGTLTIKHIPKSLKQQFQKSS